MKIYNIFFSPNTNTKRIAKYFSEKLDTIDINLNNKEQRQSLETEIESLAILSIPTYAQNIPLPIRSILQNIHSKYVLINVTYGGLSYGNMVYEIKKKLVESIVIGYSITPVAHSYIDKKVTIDFTKYDTLIQRIKNQIFDPVQVPYRIKNIFANFLEKYRTIFNYKIRYEEELCTRCKACINNCPVQAINDEIQISKDCIKCARCVSVCPTKALIGKQALPLRLYLKKKQKTSVIIR